jgi:hypothetical protein
VIAELAGAAMLLFAAGLPIRSYVQLQHVEPGFDPEDVTTFGLSLPAARYSDPAAPRAFVSALVARLDAEPGVESAAVAMGLPFTSDRNVLTGFRHEGQVVPDSASMPTASMRIVSPEYFAMMKIPTAPAGQSTGVIRRPVPRSCSSTNGPHFGSSLDRTQLGNRFA